MELLSAMIGFGMASGLFCAYDFFGWGLSAERRKRRAFIRKYAASLEASYKNEKLFCRQVGIKSNQVKFHFMPSGLGKIDFSIWHEQARLEIRDKEGNCYCVPFNTANEAETLEAVIGSMKAYLENVAGPRQIKLDL